VDVKSSTALILATVIGCGLAGLFARPGVGVLLAIIGTVAVVVVATREENAERKEAERRERLRQAARR
jgi:hypothetical protein